MPPHRGKRRSNVRAHNGLEPQIVIIVSCCVILRNHKLTINALCLGVHAAKQT